MIYNNVNRSGLIDDKNNYKYHTIYSDSDDENNQNKYMCYLFCTTIKNIWKKIPKLPKLSYYLRF
jgi:hypothetical protein